MLTQFKPCPACRGEGGTFDDYVERSCDSCGGMGRVRRRFRVAPHASPIRRGALLYNVWMSRAEGMATSMEEWMMYVCL